MTAFTITSSINIDALANKSGADTYTINGGALFVDQDSRYGYNGSISASMGSITLSAVVGGSVEFNATAVRLVSFDSGSGFVPLSNVIISSSNGASGSLIGVYPSLTTAPLVTGSVMPVSGYLKIKRWNGITFSSGTLFGITGSSPGNDVAGWIEIAGVDASTATVNRLNLFKVRGAWYDLGLTTGSPSSSYQIPSNGQLVYAPGVWVETFSGSNRYEFYPSVGSGSITSSIATDAVRGKYCWISTSGSVQFQPVTSSITSSNTAGYLPSASLHVRIPNVFFVTTTAANKYENVLPNAVLATRYDFTTTGGGAIDIDKALMNWYPSFAQPFSVALTDVGIMTQLLVSEIAQPISWSQIGVGQEAANAQFGLSMATCFAGGTITDSVFSRATLGANLYVGTLTDVNGITFTNVNFMCPRFRISTAAGALTMLRANNCNFYNCALPGGRTLITTCVDLQFSGTTYYDNPETTTYPSQAAFLWDIASTCARLKFDGLSFSGLPMVQPYLGILNVGAAGCTDIKLRNLGTFSSPLDLGGPEVRDVPWSRIGTAATVTSSLHGLKVGDSIYVKGSTSTAAITENVVKLILTASSDQFVFAALNAGFTTGSLASYAPVTSANVFVLAAAAAANDIEVKRCYTPHTRTNLFTADNSTKNVLLENVRGDMVNVPANTALNCQVKDVNGTLPAVQTSVYGTHWFDVKFVAMPPVSSSVPWSRVGVVATVTSSLHGMRTTDVINVITSSATGSILLGQKSITSVPSSSFFTFACVSAGPTTGTLDFVPLVGRLGLQMNESTMETTDQVSIDSGSSGFNSAGSLYMPTVGQQVTFTTPDYFRGLTGFHHIEPVMLPATASNNFDITYAIDKNDGSGYSVFKNLSYPRSGAAGSVGSQTITMASTTGVNVGDAIFGINVAPLAYVTSVVNPTTIGVNLANVGTVSGSVRFSQLSSETVSPDLGFKLKVRIKTTAINNTPFSTLYVLPKLTPEAQSVQYPLDIVTLTLTNLKNPSEVRVFDVGSINSFAGSESVVSGTFTANIDVAAHPTVDISVLSLNYQNLRLLSQSLGTGLTIPVSQIIDRQYINP